MPLTVDQFRLIQKWFDKHIPFFKCPMCDSNNYAVNDDVVVPRTIENGIVVPDTGIRMKTPMIQVICNECGHITHFSSAIIGII